MISNEPLPEVMNEEEIGSELSRLEEVIHDKISDIRKVIHDEDKWVA